MTTAQPLTQCHPGKVLPVDPNTAGPDGRVTLKYGTSLATRLIRMQDSLGVVNIGWKGSDFKAGAVFVSQADVGYIHKVDFLSQLQARSQNVYSPLVWLVLPLLGLLCLSLVPWSPLGVKQSKPSPACNTSITGFSHFTGSGGVAVFLSLSSAIPKKAQMCSGKATSGCAWTERCLSWCSWLG